MEKNAFMSAAKKARIALAVMAVCGMSFGGGGARKWYSSHQSPATHP